MKRCPKCRNLMPLDETRCIRCGNNIELAARKESILPVEVKSIRDRDPRTSRRLNWLQVFAAVLTSKLFFFAACAAGTVVGVKLTDDLLLEAGGHQGADRRMMVVAQAPGPKDGGTPVVHHVMYGGLERFKVQHPGYSFLLPPGGGRVDDRSAEMYTSYSIRPAGAGKVLVETKFNHELLDVFGRYEATETAIQPLYSKAGSNYLFGLTFGFALACLFGLAGLLLRNFAP